MEWNVTRRAMTAGGLLLLGGAPALGQQGKARPDLYRWEDGDPTLEFARESLKPTARISPVNEPGQPLVLGGRVTSWDKNQPVADVVIMAYQTNAVGKYDLVPADGRKRIRLRGWTRTGADGRYSFRTVKPGMYPSRDMPAHIHLTVFEPGHRPYWIDDVVFEGEPLAGMGKQALRGGSGVVRLTPDASGVLQAVRDIRLERHPA
jgi:protocatechuate 3,4-dioxygenase beta subunit